MSASKRRSDPEWHFQSYHGTNMSIHWHPNSEHFSIRIPHIPDMSVQGHEIQIDLHDEKATLWLWTTKGDLSTCLPISQKTAKVLDTWLQTFESYQGLDMLVI